MVFQLPILLWWAVPVVAFIVLLYLLKIRRRTVKVPAVFLFPRITTDVRANALWQRLRFHWLMVLQILVAILLISALARPTIKSRGFQGQTVVFVLDASASMKSKDFKPSRFAEGKRRIERWLSDLRVSDQSALILAASEPKVVASLSHDHTRLKWLLDNLKPTDAPADVGSALRLAAALVTNRPNATIVLVSDGSFEPVTDFSPGSAKLAYESVGNSDSNAGFVVMDGQRRGNQVRFFFGLRNFSTKPLKGTLSLMTDGKLSAAKEMTLQPKQLVGETVLVPATVKQVKVKWECADDVLPSDDEINFVGIGRQPVRILLVSSGNFFLERALVLEPDCIVDKSPKVPETEKGSGVDGRYDVVVFDGTKPEPVKAKAVWLIGVADGEFVRKVGVDDQPMFIVWEREHPVLRFVDLGSVLIDKALKVEIASWAKSIADGKRSPLLVVGERRNKRWLFIGFNLLDSDLPLRVGFPILIANALRWSVGGQSWEQGFVVKAGNVVTLTVPSQPVSIRYPEGKSETVNATENLLTLRATEKVGVYEIRSGNLKAKFAVNLLNADESDISPKQTITLGAHTVAAQTAKVTWRDLWWLFILLALIVLAIEWAIFTRWS